MMIRLDALIKADEPLFEMRAKQFPFSGVHQTGISFFVSIQLQHITSQSSVEEQIIYLFKDRDKSAIRLVFENYGAILKNIIMRVVKDDAMADDVLQDVLLKVWKNSESYDTTKGSIFTWLTRISKNAAIDKTRTRDFRQTETSKTAVDLVSLSDTVADEDKLDQLYMKQLIEQLPEKQRELIDLAYFQGYTQREISDNLKLPLGTVKTRIRLAIKHLRSII